MPIRMNAILPLYGRFSSLTRYMGKRFQKIRMKRDIHSQQLIKERKVCNKSNVFVLFEVINSDSDKII